MFYLPSPAKSCGGGVKCFFRDVLELLSPGRIAVSEIKAGIWQRV